mmetsp:Transcript_251/g.459  ORF Transcript_251/g.459 Transcript_251/m.459 type:complete len:127 (+) Transcript_251:67-447(+)
MTGALLPLFVLVPIFCSLYFYWPSIDYIRDRDTDNKFVVSKIEDLLQPQHVSSRRFEKGLFLSMKNLEYMSSSNRMSSKISSLGKQAPRTWTRSSTSAPTTLFTGSMIVCPATESLKALPGTMPSL